MNPIDDQLDRLFRAGGAQRALFPEPYGLETRVLAAWREARYSGGWSPALLVRGLLAACAIMLLSFWPLLKTTTVSSPASDYLQLADSTLQTGNSP